MCHPLSVLLRIHNTGYKLPTDRLAHLLATHSKQSLSRDLNLPGIDLGKLHWVLL